MSKKNDLLDDWLGISPAEQPPDHYRLIGVEQFEPNLETIEEAANCLKAKLQTKAKDGFVEEAKELYEEIKKAKRVLLNSERKAIYDRLLQKESQIKSIVPPSRSARKSKPNLNVQPVSSQSNSDLRKPMHKNAQALSPAVVWTALAIMAIGTIGGVFLIISLGKAEPSPPNVAAKTTNTTPTQITEVVRDPKVESTSQSKQPKATSTAVPNTEPAKSSALEDSTAKADPAAKASTTMPESQPAPNTSQAKMAADAKPPSDHAFWESTLGLSSAVQGNVAKAHESQSGKTRYLFFTQDRNDAMAFLRTRKVDEELSLEYLQSLRGKTVVVRGKVVREIGSKRIGIEIVDRSQIELLD